MMPLEIKQIKNALQKEENQNPSSNNLFVQDFSNIQGASPLVESPKGYNNDFDMKYYSKYQPDPFKTLSPRLKEMVVSNKDALSNVFSLIFTEEILIKNNDKLKKILTIQKQSEQTKNEQVRLLISTIFIMVLAEYKALQDHAQRSNYKPL